MDSLLHKKLIISGITILMAIVLGVISPFIGEYVLLAIAGLLITIISFYYIPELPLAILISGMSIWTIIPDSITYLFSGFSILVTLFFIAISLIAFQLLHGIPLHKPHLTVADIGLFVFTIWLAIANFWSPSPEYGETKVIGFIIYNVVIYIIVRLFYSPNVINFQRVAVLMVMTGLFNALIAIRVGLATGYWNPAIPIPAATSVLTRNLNINIIEQADYIGISILATLGLIITGSTRLKVLLIPILGLLGWAFLTYQQRGASLGLITAVVVFFLMIRYQASKKTSRRAGFNFRLILGLLGLLGLALFVYSINPQFDADYIQTDNNVLVRYSLAADAWETFLDNPVGGVGTGGMSYKIKGISVPIYAHNRFLEVLAETGLLGLVFLFIFLFGVTGSMIKALGKMDRNNVFPLAMGISGFASRLVVSMFSTSLVGWNIGVWSALIVSLAVVLNQRTSPALTVSKSPIDGCKHKKDTLAQDDSENKLDTPSNSPENSPQGITP